MFTQLNYRTSQSLRGLYKKALDCFVRGFYRASIAMCRAAFGGPCQKVGYDDRTLVANIMAAESDKVLGTEETTLAYGARLLGNLHRETRY